MFGYCSMGSEFIEMNPTSANTILTAHAITYLLINILFFIIVNYQLSIVNYSVGAAGKSTFCPSCKLLAPMVTILSPTFRPLVTM